MHHTQFLFILSAKFVLLCLVVSSSTILFLVAARGGVIADDKNLLFSFEVNIHHTLPNTCENPFNKFHHMLIKLVKDSFTTVCSIVLSLNRWFAGRSISCAKITRGSMCIIWPTACVQISQSSTPSALFACPRLDYAEQCIAVQAHTHNPTDSTFSDWGNLCHTALFPQVHACTRTHVSSSLFDTIGNRCAPHILASFQNTEVVRPAWFGQE